MTNVMAKVFVIMTMKRSTSEDGNNQHHRKGTHQYANRDVYSGGWKDDSQHGLGHSTFLMKTSTLVNRKMENVMV
jgi:hypothetical protein